MITSFGSSTFSNVLCERPTESVGENVLLLPPSSSSSRPDGDPLDFCFVDGLLLFFGLSFVPLSLILFLLQLLPLLLLVLLLCFRFFAMDKFKGSSGFILLVVSTKLDLGNGMDKMGISPMQPAGTEDECRGGAAGVGDGVLDARVILMSIVSVSSGGWDVL